jgi:hypothetical protein
MTTSAASRRAFLAGSVVAVGGLAMAGGLVTRILTWQAAGAPRGSIRDLGLGSNEETAETMGLYMLDLPRPPGDTGPTGFDLAEP